MQRAFTSILSVDVGKAAEFYQELLGMSCHFISDGTVVDISSLIAG